MLKKIYSSPFFYPLVLVAICLFIAFKNYTRGTFLTGWDTLHPEFNFPLNFQRLLFGVWRPEQGFGALAGHSHMADLPRVFILWLFHFIFPLSFLRYSYIFLCLILGPLGFYFFTNYILRITYYEHKHVALLSFLGSLSYLLNLGTIQQFYVPFEMFPTQWSYLPWIILFSLKYLQHPSKKYLILNTFFIILATPQSYAAHLWYPFFGAYCLFLIIYNFSLTKNFKLKIKNSAVLIGITLVINSFWLLPNIYYLTTSAAIPQENQQNRLHSQEFLLKNRQTGNLADATLIKGFYFDWNIYNFKTKNFQQLMPEWRDHTQNWDVKLIGYCLFISSLIGLGLAFYQKDKIFFSLSPFFIIPFVLLANATFPFNHLFDLLLKIPLLAEILRFIFTKLSILQTFGQTLFFVYFLHYIFQKISPKIITGITFISLFVYTAPIFSGFLISPLIRTKIPDSYFQLWQFMQEQPQGRVLGLPLHDPAGWSYTSWDYQGSGFIWFGLPQSITDRDNDRWETVNEESYREFFTSLYSTNPQQLINTLAKYKINYLLWDKNVISTLPKNQSQVTFVNETDRLFQQLIDTGIISPLQHFDQTNIYRVNLPSSTIELKTNLPANSPAYHWGYIDNLTSEYFTPTDNKIPSTFYPFRQLLTATNRLDSKLINISNDHTSISFPTFTGLPIMVNPINYSAEKIFSINNGNPNISYDSLANSISLYTYNSTNGVSFTEDLPHNQGYIVGIESKFVDGLTLRLCVKNLYNNLCVLNDEVSKFSDFDWDYFLVPPLDQNQGYEFQINAISYGGQLSLGQLKNLVIIPIPYQELSQIHTDSPTLPPSQNTLLSFKSYLNQSFYKINLNKSPPNSILTLNQSFNAGWLAFYFDNHKIKFLKNHVLVNNWANGWQLPITNYQLPITIYLFFWPQLLEFFGLLLIPITFIFIYKNNT